MFLIYRIPKASPKYLTKSQKYSSETERLENEKNLVLMQFDEILKQLDSDTLSHVDELERKAKKTKLLIQSETWSVQILESEIGSIKMKHKAKMDALHKENEELSKQYRELKKLARQQST